MLNRTSPSGPTLWVLLQSLCYLISLVAALRVIHLFLKVVTFPSPSLSEGELRMSCNPLKIGRVWVIILPTIVKRVTFFIWIKMRGISAVLMAKQASIVVNQKGNPTVLIITDTTS